MRSYDSCDFARQHFILSPKHRILTCAQKMKGRNHEFCEVFRKYYYVETA